MRRMGRRRAVIAGVTLAMVAALAPPAHAGHEDPIAQRDALKTSEDTSGSVNVLANDQAVHKGGTLYVRSSTSGTKGSVTCTSSGQCTYTPYADTTGSDAFTYEVCEQGKSGDRGRCSTGTVSVTITPVNDAPTATDDSASTDEDTPTRITVTTNDSDVDGDTLTASGSGGTTQGGTFSCSGTSCTYDPADNFSGTDSFSYTVSDGNGASDTAAVTVTVREIEDAPTAVDDSAQTDEDTPTTIAVTANDRDGDGDALTASGSGATAQGGTFSCSGDSCAYTPPSNFSGTDSFNYTVSDGGDSDTATVTVTVVPVNDAPRPGTDTLTTTEDTPADVSVLSNDDPGPGEASQTLSVTGNTDGTKGSVSCTNAGVCTYTPNQNATGSDRFTYTVCDNGTPSRCSTGTVNVSITAVNDAPVAADDSASTNEDTPTTIAVTANDTDPDGDALTASGSGATAQGGTFSCSGDSCAYTPPANFSGTDTFDYTVSDGQGGTDTAAVTVSVAPVNDAPTAATDTLTVIEDTAGEVDVVANDSAGPAESSQRLSLTNASHGAKGTVSCTSAGVCTYRPGSNATGSDQFTYTVCDSGSPSKCSTGSVNVSITPANDAPNAVDDSASTNEDSATTIDVTANDSDADGDALTASGSGATTQGGTFSCSGDSCSYAPPANFSGTDTFDYTVSDGQGGLDTATVTVSVAPVNDAPDAVNDAASTAEDRAVTTTVIANDRDQEGEALVITAFSQGSNGSVTCEAAGTCTYAPTRNLNGVDSYTYTISDGDNTDTATVTVEVAAVNDAPVAADDSASTDEDTATTIAVTANDTDPDGDAVTASGSGATAQGGTFSCSDDSCAYAPAADFSRTDTFDYTVSDGQGGADTATVVVTVEPVYDPPPGGSTNPPPPPADTTAPWADADADTQIISPNGDGRLDRLHVHAVFSETTQWRFTITRRGATSSTEATRMMLVTGSGRTLDVVWDGTTASGTPVAEGHYVWRIEGEDAAGNAMAPVAGSVQVDRTGVLFSRVAVDPNPFHLKKHDVTAIRYSVSEAARVRAKLVKRGRTIKRFRVHRFLRAGSAGLLWNGRDDDGELVARGRYRVVLRASDQARNVTVNRTLTIRVRR